MMIYLRKATKMYDASILTIYAFDYNVLYYPQVLWEGCLYKLVRWILQMLHYSKTDISKGIDFNNTSAFSVATFIY